MKHSAKIPVPGPCLPRDRAMHATVRKLAELHNRGLLISSDTIIAEPLPDGRYRLHLHPRIVSQFR